MPFEWGDVALGMGRSLAAFMNIMQRTLARRYGLTYLMTSTVYLLEDYVCYSTSTGRGVLG